MGRAWQISLFRAGHSFLISELVGGRILKLLLQGSHPLVIESNMNLGTAVKGLHGWNYSPKLIDLKI